MLTKPTNAGIKRIRGRNPKGFRAATGKALSPQLQIALAPLLGALETITARIREYHAQIEKLVEKSDPEVALLKQVKGVGTLIALTYVLTLEEPKKPTVARGLSVIKPQNETIESFDLGLTPSPESIGRL